MYRDCVSKQGVEDVPIASGSPLPGLRVGNLYLLKRWELIPFDVLLLMWT